MRKTTTSPITERITVDIDALQTMLGIGRANAYRIAEEAHAVVSIGRRKLFIVQKVREYMESLSEGRQESDPA